MAEVDRLQRQLLQAQNADGGWGYFRGNNSWTETTAFALLALESLALLGDPHARGCAWLARNQRSDGGFPPNPEVHVSTWVTSLAALALSKRPSYAARHRSAVQWLVAAIRPEADFLERVIARLRGPAGAVQPPGGSPWFPHTAAWLTPTAMSVLALSDAAQGRTDPTLNACVRQAQAYILSCRCLDGGWNHGGSRYLSENAASYPETTGMALLALPRASTPEISTALRLAEAYLRAPGSVEALSWLQLALVRHGRTIELSETNLRPHTTRDISLRLLALTGSSPSNKMMKAIA